MTSYKYIGPKDLLELIKDIGKGDIILSPQDVISWIKNTDQILDGENSVIATYIVNLNKELLIADRHSEHVVCAGGENVLAAGEITFTIENNIISISEITNQSTGYCPDIDSWNSLKDALNKTGMDHPDEFGREFIFRKCDNCGLVNLVKDDWFVCVSCNSDLSKLWNLS